MVPKLDSTGLGAKIRTPQSPTAGFYRQSSSGVEQGTHKPLVGSSTLPSATTYPFRVQIELDSANSV